MAIIKNMSTPAVWGFMMPDAASTSTSVAPPPRKPSMLTKYDQCAKKGLILPLMDERNWAESTRAILYFAALLYAFLGVAVLSEALMRAVERITSSTRKVKSKMDESSRKARNGNGRMDAVEDDDDDASDLGEYDQVRIWNPTVANLTLMILASHAPQILLPMIELAGNDFYAEELGPATILGCAAFNLFIVIPVCILAVPATASKRIESKRVFLTAICWSVFAYIWLIIILLGFSPYIVDIWEATLSLIFVAIALLTAYLADKNICERWSRPRLIVASHANKETITVESGIEEGGAGIGVDQQVQAGEIELQDDTTEPLRNSIPVMRWREQIVMNPLDYYCDTSEWREISRSCAREHPELPPYELAKLVAYRVDNQRPHDRLWYRIRAIQRLSASIKSRAFFDPDERKHVSPAWLLSTGGMRMASSVSSIATLRQATTITRVKRVMTIEFSARVYVLEPGTENRVRVTVIRRGRTHKKAMFRYETLNGTAQRDTHYVYKCETLVFQPGETHKVINLDILNGTREWKRRDMFYVKLELDNIMTDDTKIRIGQANPAEILYPAWERDNVEVEFARGNTVVRENEGMVRLPIVRKGAIKDTECTLEWSTEDITAIHGKDYEGAIGELQFYEGEREKYLDINIIDDVRVEKTETFAVNINNVNTGAAGLNNRAVVTILNDDRTNRFLTTVDQMVPTVLHTLEDNGRTWRDQLMEASTVNDGDVENAGVVDCIAHVIAFPWKVLRALIPPANLLGGWLTFFVALFLIGVLTTVIADLATIFSCTVNLAQSLMAITVMSIGFGLPDALSGRLAAIMDKTADAAIGSIPGINLVTSLLGIGFPWFIASILWTVRGQPFFVTTPGSSSIGFGVTVFTICSIFCYGVLFARRYWTIFGMTELGGRKIAKYVSASFLLFVWFIFALLMALQAYGVIKGF